MWTHHRWLYFETTLLLISITSILIFHWLSTYNFRWDTSNIRWQTIFLWWWSDCTRNFRWNAANILCLQRWCLLWCLTCLLRFNIFNNRIYPLILFSLCFFQLFFILPQFIFSCSVNIQLDISRSNRSSCFWSYCRRTGSSFSSYCGSRTGVQLNVRWFMSCLSFNWIYWFSKNISIV